MLLMFFGYPTGEDLHGYGQDMISLLKFNCVLLKALLSTPILFVILLLTFSCFVYPTDWFSFVGWMYVGHMVVVRGQQLDS